MATDPEEEKSSMARTVCKRNGEAKPSTVKFM
jgi:hypothetical protein